MKIFFLQLHSDISMKLLFTITLFSFFLTGCQNPIVKTHSYTLDTIFVVNGKRYEVKSEYTCYYEDLTWFSSRGPDWHARGGVDPARIIGSLEDGTVFEILPRWKYLNWGDNFCPGKSESIDARLFVENDSTHIESFDKLRNLSSSRNVELIDTKLSLVSSGLARFVESYDWPKAVQPSRRYYTVQAVIYEKTAWKNRNKEVADLITNKQITWLEDGKTYPFLKWTSNDVAFARLRESDPNLNGYSDPEERLPLIPKGDEWILLIQNRDPVQWLLESIRSNMGSEKLSQWIVYKENRIELPTQKYYRTFYQPEYDRLIEFRIEHVDLW